MNPEVSEIFTKYRKTHNQGVFDVYTPDIRRCRKSGEITGLPDAYSRGRIIGNYRRVALYGIDFLMKDKLNQFNSLQADLENGVDLEEVIRRREEINEQYKALGKMKEMAASYGYDISGPARNAQEAIQWTYFGYLAAIKSQNGAAMSFGRVSSFLDIYIERDLKNGVITETQAQEFIDHLVMKLVRTPAMGLLAALALAFGAPSLHAADKSELLSGTREKVTEVKDSLSGKMSEATESKTSTLKEKKDALKKDGSKLQKI